MKNLFPITLAALTALGGLTTSASAGLVNGSFESWTLHGWNLSIDQGVSSIAPFNRPAGMGGISTAWGDAIGVTPPLVAIDGHGFAALHTRANGNFIGSGSYNITLSQYVHLEQGELLSGWAYFHDGDPDPEDSAWVRILDQANSQIASPWSETSGGISLSSLSVPNWSSWSWLVPATGNYTVLLGMTTSGDNNSASHGFFDGLLVQPPGVIPEPGAMALGLMGSFLIGALRRKYQR